MTVRTLKDSQIVIENQVNLLSQGGANYVSTLNQSNAEKNMLLQKRDELWNSYLAFFAFA